MFEALAGVLNIWIDNGDIYWIIAIIVLMVLIKIYYSKFRGFMGEFWVRQELNKLPKDKYSVLNDIMIKDDKGTHQIDHIVISEFGMFVIEMKNYYGLITGNEYKDTWTQQLGKTKNAFYNPMRQNYGHVKALSACLSLEESKFIPIVCFSNQAKLKVQTKKPIAQTDTISEIVASYKDVIEGINCSLVKDTLISMNITDRSARSQHVKDIKMEIAEKEDKIAENICPKCGGNLVERKGKYGTFIGCSNYPKCKYTNQK